MNPGVDRGHQYAIDIVNSKIPACKWIILACQRYLDDLKKDQFTFDPQAAERVIKFCELLPHTKGKWAAKNLPFVLSPWQCFFVMNIFGWKKHDGFRRYQKALLLVPRKNGKSALASKLGLYMMTADGEHGAEVYSVATTESQAWEVFEPAKIAAQKTPEFCEHYGVGVNAKSLYIEETNSKFKPLIGDPKDGQSPSCAIVDEYHEHKDDGAYDTMDTGMLARDQPLLLTITTAGSNIAGPCYQLQKEAERDLLGVMPADEMFAMIYTVDDPDDWAKVDALEMANPNFGVSVNDVKMKSDLQNAINNPRKQSVYKTKHLNIWVGSMDSYFNLEKWNKCAEEIRIEGYFGRDAYLGLDLASKVDIASLELLIPLGSRRYAEFGFHFIPESKIKDPSNEHYIGWSEEGYLIVTEGDIIDFNVIKDKILEILSQFRVVELAYDPFQATMLAVDLMQKGVPVVEYGATVKNFSDPMKELDALITAGQITHAGNKAMAWMISNVVAKQDAKDNVYPRKERDENKIDGPVALISALGRAMLRDGTQLDDFLNDPLGASFS